MKRLTTILFLLVALPVFLFFQDFKLGASGYFNCKGVDAMLFNDYYPEGHQGGVSIIMHGKRVVTNGDIRFDETPGQRQPVPRKISSSVENGALVTKLAYPYSSRHATGFNLEIFPGWVLGKPYLMDGKSGIYPQQANGPVQVTESYTAHLGNFYQEGKPYADFDGLNKLTDYSPFTADAIVAKPYAEGRRFTSRPDDPYMRFTITSETAPLKLYDGRMNHNNGWFVLRSEIPAGATKGAVRWYIEPNVVEDWLYKPVVQLSQVGYMPNQQKLAIIECDKRDDVLPTASVYKFTDSGEQLVKTIDVKKWDGQFLRYTYAKADFSDINEPGAYVVRYGRSESPVFRIDEDVFDRGVWQPVIEYFLPVQMCHMRVSDKYRVWHDACHMDDAQMAAPGNYLDGYVQPEDSRSDLPVGRTGADLNVGGWHDLRQYVLLGDSSSMTDNIPGNADDRWVFTDDGRLSMCSAADLHIICSSCWHHVNFSSNKNH